MDTIDYKATFLSQFEALKRDNPLFHAMEQTVEDSPWHREKNVLVHTEMVVGEYITAADQLAAGQGKWDRDVYLGAIACAFHDVGKPVARTEKFSEARGKYYSYPGHELVSARLFEDYAAQRHPMFSADDIYRVCWMIEHHMPWDIKDATKLANMAATLQATELYWVFPMVLRADQFGRISDDAETKRAEVHKWITMLDRLGDVVFKPIDGDDVPTLYVPIAPSGAGKSTFRKTLADDVNAFSLDDLRHEFYNTEDYAAAFDAATKDPRFDSRANARYHEVIKQKQDLVLDNTNCSAKRRRWYLDIARKHGYRTVAVLFPITIQQLCDRQHTRTDKTVPEHAVRRQYMSLQLPSYGEFDHVATIDANIVN